MVILNYSFSFYTHRYASDHPKHEMNEERKLMFIKHKSYIDCYIGNFIFIFSLNPHNNILEGSSSVPN